MMAHKPATLEYSRPAAPQFPRWAMALACIGPVALIIGVLWDLAASYAMANSIRWWIRQVITLIGISWAMRDLLTSVRTRNARSLTYMAILAGVLTVAIGIGLLVLLVSGRVDTHRQTIASLLVLPPACSAVGCAWMAKWSRRT
jgi:hypothetical protein